MLRPLGATGTPPAAAQGARREVDVAKVCARLTGQKDMTTLIRTATIEAVIMLQFSAASIAPRSTKLIERKQGNACA